MHKTKRISVKHEIFSTPKHPSEGVYVDYHPTDLGATFTEATSRGEKVWMSSLVKEKERLTYSKGRMGKLVDEEKEWTAFEETLDERDGGLEESVMNDSIKLAEGDEVTVVTHQSIPSDAPASSNFCSNTQIILNSSPHAPSNLDERLALLLAAIPHQIRIQRHILLLIQCNHRAASIPKHPQTLPPLHLSPALDTLDILHRAHQHRADRHKRHERTMRPLKNHHRPSILAEHV